MLQEPTSMDECVYFTNRIINEKGKVKAWVFKKTCPQCKESVMSKPKENGKVKIRSKEFVCYKCGYKENEEEYEKNLICNIKYTCPYCSYEGEIQVPFARKKVRVLNEETLKKTNVEVIRFQCQNCKKNIDITKKMK